MTARLLFPGLTAAATLGTAALLATPYAWAAPLPAMAAFGALALFRWPELGFLGLVFLIPLETLRELSESLSLAKLVGVAAIGVTGLLLLMRRLDARRLQAPVLALGALFLAHALLSAWLTEYPDASSENMRQFGTTFAFFILALLYLGSSGEIVRCLSALIASVTIPALFSVWQGLTGKIEATRPAELMREDERAMGLMRDPNFFSVVFIVSGPILAAWLLTSRTPARKAFCLGLLALHATALVLTYSRAALLIMILEGLILSPLLLRRLRARHLGFAMLGGLLFLSALVAVTPKSVFERVASIAGKSDSGYVDPSIERRKSYIPVALRNIAHNPLFGSGPGSFPYVYSESEYPAGFALRKEDFYRMAHNTWLEIASDTGLPGLAIFAGLVGLTAMNLRRARRDFAARGDESGAILARCLGVSFLGLLLIVTTISAPYHRYLWLFAALSHGLATVARRQPTQWSRHDNAVPQRFAPVGGPRRPDRAAPPDLAAPPRPGQGNAWKRRAP